jgi:ketosteroid isomerase-like protein
MSEQDNVRLIKEQYAAFQRGDLQSVLDTMTDDIEWITPGPQAFLPLAGNRRGREEVTQFFSILSDTNEYSLFEPLEFIAQGDRVVVLVKAQGTVKATGYSIEAEMVHLFTVRDGKVERFREFYDTAAILDAYRPAAAADSSGA